MGTLFLSFSIAIAGAVGLVAMSRIFDLDTYTSRIFPLIPILYAIIYNALEQGKTRKAKPIISPSQAKEEMKAGVHVLFRNITAVRIITDVGVSFGIKFTLEIVLAAAFLSMTGQSFRTLYGAFGIETVGRFLRGDHPWLEASDGILILALISLIASFGTGLWIGSTSKGKAILEGVLAGAAVTFITAMTNMLLLYRRIEEEADRMAASFGLGIPVGFVIVLVLQVLLYGLWSGIAQKSREERALRREIRKSVRKPKR